MFGRPLRLSRAAGNALAQIDPGADPAAIAGAGARAERQCVGDNDGPPFAGQFQRRRQPGIAAADDENLAGAGQVGGMIRARPRCFSPERFGFVIGMEQ